MWQRPLCRRARNRPALPPQLQWQGSGADGYIVTAYDAYTGRPVGVEYKTRDNGIAIDGLPLGTPLDVVVQVRA